jgi:hypothetical protein
MKRMIAMALLVTMLVSLAACDIERGSEQATQGKSGNEGGSPESARSQTKQDKPKKPERVKGKVAKKSSQEKQQHKPEPEPASKNIPGLTPQDVYVNLENRGFKCSEPELMGADNEVRWTCEKQEAQGEYLVEIYSKDANSVRLVEAWVISHDDPARADALAQDFLGYVARAPYEGAQPQEAKAWVEQHVGSKASAEFGGVSYTLGVKGGSRFLELEKLEG